MPAGGDVMVPGQLHPGSRCVTPVTHFLDPALTKTPVSAPLDDSVGLDVTPTGAALLEYKYYCPICFRNFKRALATQCCSNTVCEGCARSFVQQASMHAPINVLVQQHPDTSLDVGDCFADDEGVLSPISMVVCPFCCGNMRLKRQTSAPARSYKDSPAVAAKPSSLAASQSPYAFRSPARSGDSFEQLRRRVKPLESLPTNLPLTQKVSSTPRTTADMPPRPPPRSVYASANTTHRMVDAPRRGDSNGTVTAYRTAHTHRSNASRLVIESAMPPHRTHTQTSASRGNAAADRPKKEEEKKEEAKKKRSCCIS